jgi:hypothetical protein
MYEFLDTWVEDRETHTEHNVVEIQQKADCLDSFVAHIHHDDEEDEYCTVIQSRFDEIVFYLWTDCKPDEDAE